MTSVGTGTAARDAHVASEAAPKWGGEGWVGFFNICFSFFVFLIFKYL